VTEQILPNHGPGRRPDGPPSQSRHLEQLVSHYGRSTGVAPERVRRWVSVMVLLGALGRVGEQETPRFLLKGGIAIELRLRHLARATKDVDLIFFGEPEALEDDLDEALAQPYAGFAFQRHPAAAFGDGRFRRVEIRLFYRDRSWATLKLEVAQRESEQIDAEVVEAIPLDEFGLLGPEIVPCLSTRFQIAQKIHAVTEQFEDRHNSRFRDLIDLLLLRDISEDREAIRDACIEIFDVRAQHAWPPELVIQFGWAERFPPLARAMEFPITDVEEAAIEVRAFIAEIDAAQRP
jgi:Nucleotidyl transferase AbiEii toxin, Type IV TA system